VEKLFIVPLKYPFTLNKEGSWMVRMVSFGRSSARSFAPDSKFPIFKSK
jgi:hypothetical protein